MAFAEVEVDTTGLLKALEKLTGDASMRRFAQAVRLAAAEVMVPDMKERSPEDTGDLIESIKAFGPNKVGQEYHIDVGSFGIIYAAMQEFGGVFRQSGAGGRGVFEKTDKMNGFFWHMFYQTGDSKWRAFALADELNVPAHPYIRPAFEATWRKVVERTAEILRDDIK